MSLAEDKYRLYIAIKKKPDELTSGELDLLFNLAKDEDILRIRVNKLGGNKEASPTEKTMDSINWSFNINI